MITPEELRKAGDICLEKTKLCLETTGNFSPALAILKDGELVNLPFPANWMNDPGLKSILFSATREVVKALRADAVIFISDVWTLEPAPAVAQRLKDDPAYLAEYEQLTHMNGVPEMAQLGYGELWEAIMISVQSQLYQFMLTQRYKRKPDGAFSHWGCFKAIDTSNGGAVRGKMQFFEEARTA